MSTVESRLYLHEEPNYWRIMDLISRQRRAMSPYRITMNIHLMAGREESLPNEFPYPQLLDELRERLREVGSVETLIRSWVDPEKEEDQAAWVIVVRC
ncbi:MAG: hypothetical protein KBC02_02030 [Candidatus Pacebacteria bacterium]|nr:hypothetical protein [Candidatus Paceibacterota bacterium]